MFRGLNNSQLTDTDSLLFKVQTEDWYRDMMELKEELDTSNYDPNDPLYSDVNKAVPGKFKVVKIS